MYLAPSIEDLFTRHYFNLKNDKYFNDNGELSVFKKNPIDNFGSITITNGIMVEA